MRFNCGPIIGGPLPKDSERYYLKISDKNFTNKFLSKYKKLKVSDKQNDFDARIQGLIHFPDKTDTICMNGIKEIIINDIYMQATEDFSTLVNNEILKNYTIHKKIVDSYCFEPYLFEILSYGQDDNTNCYKTKNPVR